MSKISIMAVLLVAGLISPLGAFTQGSAGTGSTSTGIGSTGRARGTWNTEQRLDPATRGSDEHSHNREQQSQPFPKEFDTANKCDSKERAGLSEIVAC
jgi:hypothetical protein